MNELEIKKLLYQYSVKIFEIGLKSNPTDADNSEFTLPLIDLQLIPELLEQLRPLLMTPLIQAKIELADFMIRNTIHDDFHATGLHFIEIVHLDKHQYSKLIKQINTIKQLEGK